MYRRSAPKVFGFALLLTSQHGLKTQVLLARIICVVVDDVPSPCLEDPMY